MSFEPPTDRVHHHHHQQQQQQLHHQHQHRIAPIVSGDAHLHHLHHHHHHDHGNRHSGATIRRSGGPDGTTSKHTGPGRPSDGGGGGVRNGVGGRRVGGGGGGVGGGVGGGGGGGGAGGGTGQLSVNPGDWFRWFRRKRRHVALPPNAVPSNQIVRANHYTVEEAAAAIPVVVYASVIGQEDMPPQPPSLVDDVLYTELDRVPTPAYHNAGYAFDQHSSAYYSDMYEPIDPYHQRHNSLPSDYV